MPFLSSALFLLRAADNYICAFALNVDVTIVLWFADKPLGFPSSLPQKCDLLLLFCPPPVLVFSISAPATSLRLLLLHQCIQASLRLISLQRRPYPHC